MKRSYYRRVQGKYKFERNIIREHALALIVNDNMIAIEDLNDQYLDMLGFNMDEDESDKILKSIKSLKSNKSVLRGLTGLEQFNSDSDSDHDSEIQLNTPKTPKSSRYNRLQSIEQKKVKFQDNSEPEPIILRAQNSFKRRADNRHRTFKRITQISKNKFSNSSLVSQEQHFQNQSASVQNSSSHKVRKNNSNTYSNMDLEMLHKTQSKQEISTNTMINQLSEDKQGDSQYQRVDFELDRYFITTYYFTNSNLDKVLQRLKKPKRTLRSDHIQSLIRKSKIKPSIYSPECEL